MKLGLTFSWVTSCRAPPPRHLYGTDIKQSFWYIFILYTAHVARLDLFSGSVWNYMNQGCLFCTYQCETSYATWEARTFIYSCIWNTFPNIVCSGGGGGLIITHTHVFVFRHHLMYLQVRLLEVSTPSYTVLLQWKQTQRKLFLSQ